MGVRVAVQAVSTKELMLIDHSDDIPFRLGGEVFKPQFDVAAHWPAHDSADDRGKREGALECGIDEPSVPRWEFTMDDDPQPSCTDIRDGGIDSPGALQFE
jgi:hypothetical protein